MEPLIVLGKKDIAILREVDFKEGVAILVDKPLDWTSFNVVNKFRYVIRHHLGLKKFKIGHAGTLDPQATGLLILCAGKYTKLSTEFMGQEKEYTGTVTLGATRPSYDRETEIDEEFPYEHIDRSQVDKAMKSFVGDIMQVPPVYSAKQVDGRRAYQSARAGKELIMEACQVNIRELECAGLKLPELDFRVSCSKGTYIRSLAHDLGRALHSGAYLSELRRTRIGDHRVADALSIEEFSTALAKKTEI